MFRRRPASRKPDVTPPPPPPARPKPVVSYELTDWSDADPDEVRAAELNIRVALNGALREAEHGTGFHHLDEFTDRALAVMRRGEVIEQAAWASVALDGLWFEDAGAFLLMTGQRLLLLENVLYTGGRRRRHCVLWEADRTSLVDATWSADIHRSSMARLFEIDAGVRVQARIFGNKHTWSAWADALCAERRAVARWT
ncbi:hypothetical protein ACQPZP_36770 [Spirillospora sp. CA-142024]|uniref:hypothetical protein n=1 Tax=Spirillospora sp. CA-142024 TaxID=3240036 RepID=UPI003D8B70E0